MFVDTYLKADSFEAIASFCSQFRNVIGPQQGVVGYTDEEGVIHEAVGDPDKFYACVRATFELTAPEGITIIPQEEGAPVIGVWA